MEKGKKSMSRRSGVNVYDVRPAGFWVRVVASLVDNIIMFIITIPFVPIFYSSYEAYFLSETWDMFDTFTALFWPVVVVLLWVYWGGKTPGKAALGMHIVRVDGNPIRWKESIIRYFGYIVNVLTLGIGFFIVAFRPDKRGLHDLMAGTKVVYWENVSKYKVGK